MLLCVTHYVSLLTVITPSSTTGWRIYLSAPVCHSLCIFTLSNHNEQVLSAESSNPLGPHSFMFMQLRAKFWPNNTVGTPSLENLGSVTASEELRSPLELQCTLACWAYGTPIVSEISLLNYLVEPVANLRGRFRAPPTAEHFPSFEQFFRKFGQITCWRPLEGWHPLLRGILDPPLRTMSTRITIV